MEADEEVDLAAAMLNGTWTQDLEAKMMADIVGEVDALVAATSDGPVSEDRGEDVKLKADETIDLAAAAMLENTGIQFLDATAKASTKLMP